MIISKDERKEYEKNGEAIATYCICNFGGLEILDILYGIEDYVVCRWNFGEPGKIHCVKIRYGVNSSSIRVGNRTISLSECVKVR